MALAARLRKLNVVLEFPQQLTELSQQSGILVQDLRQPSFRDSCDRTAGLASG